MTQKFSRGDFVYAKENIQLKLVILRYVDEIYYCQVPGEDNQKYKVYFERELLSDKEQGKAITGFA